MLTDIYIEALLIDEELADQVWEAWNQCAIDNETACTAWLLIAVLDCPTDQSWSLVSDRSNSR